MKSQDLFEITNQKSCYSPMYSQKISVNELIFRKCQWAPNHRRTEPWDSLFWKEALDRFGKFMLENTKSNPEEERSERKMKGIIDKCLNSNKIMLSM